MPQPWQDRNQWSRYAGSRATIEPSAWQAGLWATILPDLREANGEIGTVAGSVRIAGQKPDMLDRSLEIEFESFRKSFSTDKARHAFDERIERLLSRQGVDYARGYVDALKDAPL
jgi:hypothetical protein